ncbi:TOBE domain-containing protein [Desulfogranum japonicum]|uniref:TOBE domain-containing protein n=1 Tax=Desulfogranum japonicum TaxID=231447 RepID=UPI000420619C|nr:TOBE domain-containing protein [Desulfogranum japonicum]
MTKEQSIQIHEVLGWKPQNPTIELLQVLDRMGSINCAAKAVGISYKSAWQKIDQLNNLFPHPLINKQTGGSGGGGTRLTEEGKQLLENTKQFQKEFSQFMQFYGNDPKAALDTLKTLRRIELKISARNVWLGQVEKIEEGAVNSVVTIMLKGGDILTSVITQNSVQRLELAPSSEVLVIVKAPSVLLAHDIAPESISARNILKGTISQILQGAVNDEITIDLPGGSSVTSIVTSASVERLGLEVGTKVSAVIKASDVLLATT